MKNSTLSLLVCLAAGTTVAYAKPHKKAHSHATLKKASALQIYLDKVQIISTRSDRANNALLDMLKSEDSARDLTSGKDDESPEVKQSLSGLRQNFYNLTAPSNARWLAAIGEARAAAKAFRDINPVPQSVASADTQFEQYSLNVDAGLDILKQWVYSRDDALITRVGQKMALARTFSDQGFQILQRTIELKTKPKTYVPG